MDMGLAAPFSPIQISSTQDAAHSAFSEYSGGNASLERGSGTGRLTAFSFKKEYFLFAACFLLAFALLFLDFFLMTGIPLLRLPSILSVQPAHAAGESNSDQPLSSQPLPRALVKETTFDFGKVTQGTSVQHSFVIENQGEAALKIEHVHTSCGCTAAVVDSDIIQPHQKTDLRVTFDTTGFQGPKVKTVRIYTNDMKVPSILLSLQGTVEADLQLSEPKLLFGEIRKGDTPSREFRVSAAPGADVRISEVLAHGELMDIQAEAQPDGKSQKVVVKLKSDIPIGAFRDRVIIKTSSKNNPVLNVPVFAKVHGDVSLDPMVVSFGMLEGPLQESAKQYLKVKSQRPHIVHVTSVSSDLSGVTAEVVGKTDDGESTIQVSVRTEVTGVFRANLMIETDSEDEGERKISVPVYGIVSKKSE